MYLRIILFFMCCVASELEITLGFPQYDEQIANLELQRVSVPQNAQRRSDVGIVLRKRPTKEQITDSLSKLTRNRPSNQKRIIFKKRNKSQLASKPFKPSKLMSTRVINGDDQDMMSSTKVTPMMNTDDAIVSYKSNNNVVKIVHTQNKTDDMQNITTTKQATTTVSSIIEKQNILMESTKLPPAKKDSNEEQENNSPSYILTNPTMTLKKIDEIEKGMDQKFNIKFPEFPDFSIFDQMKNSDFVRHQSSDMPISMDKKDYTKNKKVQNSDLKPLMSLAFSRINHGGAQYSSLFYSTLNPMVRKSTPKPVMYSKATLRETNNLPLGISKFQISNQDKPEKSEVKLSNIESHSKMTTQVNSNDGNQWIPVITTTIAPEFANNSNTGTENINNTIESENIVSNVLVTESSLTSSSEEYNTIFSANVTTEENRIIDNTTEDKTVGSDLTPNITFYDDVVSSTQSNSGLEYYAEDDISEGDLIEDSIPIDYNYDNSIENSTTEIADVDYGTATVVVTDTINIDAVNNYTDNVTDTLITPVNHTDSQLINIEVTGSENENHIPKQVSNVTVDNVAEQIIDISIVENELELQDKIMLNHTSIEINNKKSDEIKEPIIEKGEVNQKLENTTIFVSPQTPVSQI